MGYFTSPLVTECLGMDPLLADTIGVALLILIVVAILKVMFGNTPKRAGASEMRPKHPHPDGIGMYRPSGVRPPPPKPIPSRGCNGCDIARRAGVMVTSEACRMLHTGEQIPTADELRANTPVPPECQSVHESFTKPPSPARRCPSKGFGEPISCDECDRMYPPGKK